MKETDEVQHPVSLHRKFPEKSGKLLEKNTKIFVCSQIISGN
jgi:hypothetical protein